LTITLCALICGADGFGDIAFFGRSKKDWFDTFLDLPYDIPSHDVNPQEIYKCMFGTFTLKLAPMPGAPPKKESPESGLSTIL
jgi:hypothetical protein